MIEESICLFCKKEFSHAELSRLYRKIVLKNVDLNFHFCDACISGIEKFGLKYLSVMFHMGNASSEKISFADLNIFVKENPELVQRIILMEEL